MKLGVPVKVDGQWSTTRPRSEDTMLLVVSVALLVIGVISLAIAAWATGVVCIGWGLVMLALQYMSWTLRERQSREDERHMAYIAQKLGRLREERSADELDVDYIDCDIVLDDAALMRKELADG